MADRRTWLFVTLIALAGAGLLLRLATIPLRSYWYDEAFTAALTALPVGDLLAATAADVHPPLYYLLLKVAGSNPAWGEEYCRRMVSVLFSFVLVGVLGGLLAGERPGPALVATFLTAVSAIQLYYAAEIRMYPFFSLLVFVAGAALLAWLRQPRTGYLVIHLAALLAMLYTHYFAVVVAAGFAAVICTARPRPALRPLLLGYLAVAFLFLPWCGVLADKLQLTFSGRQESLNFLDPFSPLQFPLKLWHFLVWSFGADRIAPVLALLFTGLLVSQYRTALRDPLVRQLLLLIFTPVVLLAAVSLVHNVFIIRALLPLTAPLFLLFGLLLFSVGRLRLRIFLITVVALLFTCQAAVLLIRNPLPHPFAALAPRLRALAPASAARGNLVVCETQELYLVARCYLPPELCRVVQPSNLHPRAASLLAIRAATPDELRAPHWTIVATPSGPRLEGWPLPETAR